MITDATLVQGCLAGSVASQRQLFRRHRPTLQRVLARHGFQAADVAELEQRVWLRLLGPRRALASFRGQGSFAGWLLRVATNEARSELRRRRPPVDELVPLLHLRDPQTPEGSAIEDEKRALLTEALRDAVESLPKEERALLLAWADGSTADALAGACGVHRSSMSRRLEKLRRTVGVRVRACLWEHYGRGSSEISMTHVELSSCASGLAPRTARSPSCPDAAKGFSQLVFPSPSPDRLGGAA